MEKVTIDVRQSIYESASQVTAARKTQREGLDGGADGLYSGAALGEDDEEDEDDYMEVRTKDLLVLHMPELKVRVPFLSPHNLLNLLFVSSSCCLSSTVVFASSVPTPSSTLIKARSLKSQGSASQSRDFSAAYPRAAVFLASDS